jgi:hypothetical protein
LNNYSKGLPYWAAVATGSAQSGGNLDLHSLPQPAPLLGKQEFQRLLNELGRQTSMSMKARRITRWQALRQTLPDVTAIWRGLTLTNTEDKASRKKLTILGNQLQELNLFNIEVQAFEQQQESGADHIFHRSHGNRTYAHDCRYAGVTISGCLANTGVFDQAHCAEWVDLFTAGALPVCRFFQEWLLRFRSLVGLGMIAAIAFAAYTELSGGCKADDPLRLPDVHLRRGNTTPGWYFSVFIWLPY